MITATLTLAAISLILFLIAGRRQDGSNVKGIKMGLVMFKKLFPLLVFAFVTAGLLQVIVPPNVIKSLLGNEAGFKGILIGAISGALIPGGPYVAFPVASSIYKAGASLATMVAFITGWAMWSVGRLPYEIVMVGPRFSLLRYGLALIFPPLAGVIAWFVF
ncbi:MAG: hypothetical protein PWQ82_1731 [Thermosediminibacterales bacterium]|nr:hypothetical protein [Thermosediminibacterales bacterium]MDK2836247.1 hypothetical protein [Thermosediminibacterales bacterium]